MKSTTLFEKVTKAQQEGRIAIDQEALPAARCCCTRCGESIPLDYDQQREGEIIFRLMTFLKQHEDCSLPQPSLERSRAPGHGLSLS